MDRKIDGGVAIVFYMVVALIFSVGMVCGWVSHIWYSEDKFSLCAAYQKEKNEKI